MDILDEQNRCRKTTQRPFWPAARVRRTSVLPQAKPRRRGGSAALSIEIPKGGAALWAAEPKTKGHPYGCPFVLEHRNTIDAGRTRIPVCKLILL